MKIIFSTACLAPALLLLVSCGGMKHSASAPAGVQEFDQASGTWKPATKIVQPPPHPMSAPLPTVASQTPAEPEHRSVWKRMGATAKKPLHWVGVGNDEPVLPPVPAAPVKPVVAGKPEAPPAPRSPIDPRPGAKSLWQTMGEGIKAPFHWMGL